MEIAQEMPLQFKHVTAMLVLWIEMEVIQGLALTHQYLYDKKFPMASVSCLSSNLDEVCSNLTIALKNAKLNKFT